MTFLARRLHTVLLLMTSIASTCLPLPCHHLSHTTCPPSQRHHPIKRSNKSISVIIIESGYFPPTCQTVRCMTALTTVHPLPMIHTHTQVYAHRHSYNYVHTHSSFIGNSMNVKTYTDTCRTHIHTSRNACKFMVI